MPVVLPYVPQNITVHLGNPDAYAENVTVSFPEYIKNVASSEIYPTWEESALFANIYAQISFALNRVYTEYYRSRGYDFDITASTSFDQKFINGRNIFENIDRIVDEIFNDYIRRQGTFEPLFAQFCNGTTVTCAGLSQWGSQSLAQQGYNSVQILKNYYGNDIELVIDAPIRSIRLTYPSTPLRTGDENVSVRVVKVMINRISQNYPAIPKVYPVNNVFDAGLDASVRRFQEIFNLAVDGIVGKATWYRMVYLYVGVTKLSELESEGQRLFSPDLVAASSDTSSDAAVPVSASYNFEGAENSRQQVQNPVLNDSGINVSILQYYLAVVASVNPLITPIEVTGTFDEATTNAIIAFQGAYGLTPTGIADEATIDLLYSQFYGVVSTLFADDEIFPVRTVPFGSQNLYIGSSGEDVETLQNYLNEIQYSQNGTRPIGVTGNFARQTVQAVMSHQRGAELPVTGRVDRATWNSIANTYKDVMSSQTTRATQYPGYVLKEGMTDSEIKRS